MPAEVFGFATVLFLHNLFTALWMGGMLVTYFSTLPAARKALPNSPDVQKLLQAFQQRHARVVYYSMAGLILTGLLLARRNPSFSRLFAFDTAYAATLSVKHLVVIIMIGISLYRSLMAGKQTSIKGQTPGVTPQPAAQMQAKRQKRSLLLLKVNAWLAVLVLFLSGLIAALGSAP